MNKDGRGVVIDARELFAERRQMPQNVDTQKPGEHGNLVYLSDTDRPYPRGVLRIAERVGVLPGVHPDDLIPPLGPDSPSAA